MQSNSISQFLLILIYLKVNRLSAVQIPIPFNHNKCDINYVLDISNGEFNYLTKHITHDGLVYSPDKYFRHEDKLLGCACDMRVCIPKCCEQSSLKNITCESGYSPNVNVNIHDKDLLLLEENSSHFSVYWEKCSYFPMDEDFIFHIMQDGRLYSPEDEVYYEHNDYCMVRDDNEETSITELRICYHEENDIVEDIYKYGMLISIPFLLATLLVYLILPDKKLQTKCLMAYVTCLMLAYFFLIILQFNNNLEAPSCEIIAGCGVYFFMATFCWMNITCIDMYFIFSGIRAPLQRKSSNWKRFAFYVIFANGTPLILLAIIFGINTMENFTGHPGFGNGQCWLGNGLPELLYFYGPMAILLTINTILFGLTTYKIRTTMKDNKKMLRSKESGRSNEVTKQDYVMYIKLFVIMGINWTMEFISWVVNWSLGANKVNWIWYPTDFCNAIYGILIFIIFVWKKTIWIKLQQRYYIFMGKPNMARALSTHASSGYQVSQTERTNVDESTTGNTYNQVKMEQM